MSAVNIRIAGTSFALADKVLWLSGYDPEANDGRGSVRYVEDRALALVYPSPSEALAAWRAVPVCRPLREDGKPNRPLSAYTIEIVPVGSEPI